MIEQLSARDLSELREPRARELARDTLESGRILLLPNLEFELRAHEREFVDPAHPVRLRFRRASKGGRPTLLYDQQSGRLRGGRPIGLSARELRDLLGRYADWSREFVLALLPQAAPVLEQEWTTFRPARRFRAQGLHVDAANSRSIQGRCWLRVFRNVNGGGVPRVWQVGGHFEDVARQFVKRLPPLVRERTAGGSTLRRWLGIGKGPATPYDLTMRALRDLLVKDDAFQRSAPREIVEFASGATWLAYTDIALHGAVSGQHSLDQAFLIDTKVMSDPSRSSLRVLERLTGRALLE